MLPRSLSATSRPDLRAVSLARLRSTWFSKTTNLAWDGAFQPARPLPKLQLSTKLREVRNFTTVPDDTAPTAFAAAWAWSGSGADRPFAVSSETASAPLTMPAIAMRPRVRRTRGRVWGVGPTVWRVIGSPCRFRCDSDITGS